MCAKHGGRKGSPDKATGPPLMPARLPAAGNQGDPETLPWPPCTFISRYLTTRPETQVTAQGLSVFR